MSDKNKRICCNCGKLRILNHRLICNRCAKFKLRKKTNFIPTLKGNVKCRICNYPFRDNKTICFDTCCGCCPEKYSKFCSKELMVGRKGIALKISNKTKQADITQIEEFRKAEEDMFL